MQRSCRHLFKNHQQTYKIIFLFRHPEFKKINKSFNQNFKVPINIILKNVMNMLPY